MRKIEEGVFIIDGIPVAVVETQTGTLVYSLNSYSANMVCNQTNYYRPPRDISQEEFFGKSRSTRLGGLEKLSSFR